MLSIVLDLYPYTSAGGETSVPVVSEQVHWGCCARHLEWLTSAKKLQRTWHPLMLDHIVCTRQETSLLREVDASVCLLVDIIKCVHISDWKKKTYLAIRGALSFKETVLCKKKKTISFGRLEF